MTKVIVIDAGHGGHDPGATGNGHREKEEVLKMAIATRDALNRKYSGHRVVLTRSNDTFVTLQDRANIANREKADIFVSIHLNAFNGTANGFETFIFNGGVSAATRPAQNNLHAALWRYLHGAGMRSDRGQKRANFSVLRNTNMPAILTEVLFIDNAQDAALLRRSGFIAGVGEAHADGIAQAIGLPRRVQQTPPPATGQLFRVQVGAFSQRANAESLVNRLKAAGFNDAYIRQE